MYTIDAEIFNIVRAQIRVLKPAKVVTPFQDATMGPFPTFGLAMITIEDENGFVGEAPIYHTYNNIMEHCLIPILLHSHNMSYQDMYHRMYWSIRNEGYRGPASALLGQVDIALHDLAARRRGIPLHQFLNAPKDSVKVYGSGGGTNYSLEELETEIAFLLDKGTECYKMKVGKDFGTNMKEDVARVKFVRSLLGDKVRLAVDANQIWNYEQAMQFIDMAGSANLAWFEEPLHSASLTEIEKLCKSTPVEISYGESERTALVFPSLVNAGVRHLQPAPMQIVGVKEWMQIRDLAADKQIAFTAGGYSWITASFMATAPEKFQVEYLYSIMAGLEQYFCVQPEWKNGQFILPGIEGLPIRVDWDYCTQNNLVTSTRSWQKNRVNEYRPVVTM